MRSIFFLAFIFALQAISCNNGNGHFLTDVDNGNPRHSIVLKNTGRVVAGFGELFKDIRLLRLRGNDSLQIANVGKLICYKSHYFIFDNKFSAIYSIDSSGAIVASYGRIGLGNKEYRKIKDFDIDSARGRVVILSNEDLALYYYSLKDGSFIKRVHIGVFGFFLSVLPDGETLIYVNYDNNGNSGGNNLILLDSAGHIRRKYFPFDTDKKQMSISFSGFLQKSGGDTYFSPAFDENIYRYIGGGFDKYAGIRINSEFIEKNKSDHFGIYRRQIMMDSGTSFLGNKFLNNRDFIIMSYQSNTQEKIAIYSIREEKIYILKKDVHDLLIQGLQGPLYLKDDNTVIFALYPETILDLKTSDPGLFLGEDQSFKRRMDSIALKQDIYFLFAKLNPNEP